MATTEPPANEIEAGSFTKDSVPTTSQPLSWSQPGRSRSGGLGASATGELSVPLTSNGRQVIAAGDVEAPPTPSEAARFNYTPPERRPYPFLVGIVRRYIFRMFVFVVFVGSAATIGVMTYQLLSDASKERNSFGVPKDLIPVLKVVSVPLVSLLFTWFHVWLALQMMFYPIKFYGCGKAVVPRWLGLPINGWQGIVPRKADIMAQRCCEKMIGNIVTIEEFMDKVEPEHFFSTLQDVIGKISSEVLERVIMKRWPTLWAAFPASVQQELKLKVFEEVKKSFTPIFTELKRNINTILDIKSMAIDALVKEPKLMVDMFRSVAARELSFIQHVAAVMGFILGLVQVVLYMVLYDKGPYVDYVMLPVSGLIIGYFTNWLALKMTFQPVWPHMLCGSYVNIQGVFLKRQREASAKMAEVICANVVDARAMLQYMYDHPSTTDDGVLRVLEIYQRAIDRSVDESLGMAKNVAPRIMGPQLDSLKQDVLDFSIELLPGCTEEIEKYMDETMNVEATLSWRLARITPVEFERIIHPIFEEDEWILLFVGGFLGVIIGLLQAYALQNVN